MVKLAGSFTLLFVSLIANYGLTLALFVSAPKALPFSLFTPPLQHLPDEPQELQLLLSRELPLRILQTRGRNLSGALPISCERQAKYN